MKTKKYHTILLISLAIVFAGTLQASVIFSGIIPVNPPLPENAMTDINNAILPEFEFTEEAYIDDIPFDTECVSKNCVYQKALSVIFELDEEKYINDIPFKIKTSEEKFTSATGFKFEDEDYIDDIPFDTQTLANKACNKMAFNK